MHEVTVECIRVDDKRKVTDWMAYFGTRREENAAIDMDQWPSVRVFHKMEKGGSPTAYWDDELEATDEILQDPDLEINMRGVQLRRIKHGLGAFTDWQRGDAYKGRFVEGKRHGQGILYDRVGVYRGEFEDDVRHGKGIQVFANGDVYEGPFEFDKMHGPDGVLKFADGSVYEGDFAIGTPTGQGTYSSHESCERIAGDFSDGVLHGIGLHTKPTGERCEGDFVLGDLHGRGSWRSRKGDTCDGDFENGEPHGYARYNFRKGPMYDGFFRDGLRDGPGSMVYGNEYDEVSEYGGNGSGSGNGERSTSRNSNSNDRREPLSADDEDASYESGSSGDDDDDDEDEEYEDVDEDEEEEEEDGDEWGYYDDSDWYSDDEDEDNEGLRTRAQNAASSLPKSMSSNPVYHDLRLSLVDIFEDPPPTDSKAGIISLRAALEYYAQREHKRKLEELLRKRKSGSGG
ncbi:Phosphatidylinositol 4-phosphate 5-kinase 1 [Hondaea fermentalgiana]|uniref:MORN repeat-containing protein 3 n=1 Tax=Hondaea fermentalgiana TaxID=2315210 RepID=A0A2R5GTT8_9STRA|nr:Phosphatidylinositol 4-phosphate 5-kinase 1 [Hondaea fermentalgiana]|eukprot:GBG33985.1 Phosphatidylinositol 4-phosphate 5-kinase 1 [Hondaea fermentalgiana]